MRRLKSTPLYSVSVITNFVIPKRDKHHSFCSTAGARPTITTILGMVTEEVRPICAPLIFLDPSSSFAARDRGEIPPSRIIAYNLGVCPSKVTIVNIGVQYDMIR